MRNITFLLLLFFFLSNCGQTEKPEQNEIPEGTYSIEKIPAPSLSNAIIITDTEQKIGIYLPPEYEKSTNRYPTLYMLCGYSGTIKAFNDWMNFQVQLDEMINNNQLDPMIMVLISGRNELYGSFYVNSPVTGNWEDFVINDVIGYIDSNYRTIDDPDSRGISGHSMGGYGALNLAMLHPELFGAVYAMSPGLFDESGLSNCQMFATDTIIEDYLAFESSVTQYGRNDPEGYQSVYIYERSYGDLIFTIAYGSAFGWNTNRNAPFINFPYSLTEDGYEIDEEAFERWESGFGGIAVEATNYYSNWMELNAIKVDYGTMDEYAWIPEGCVYFEQVMANAGINVEVESYKGTHGGSVKNRFTTHVIPFFATNLSFK